MRPTTWKQRAIAGWQRLQAELPDSVEELLNLHYSGAGGCLHPDGKMRRDLAAEDVAYESLADDCEYILSQPR